MTKPDSDPGGEAWARLLSVQSTLVERIETALAAHDLPSITWYDVLWELEKADGGRLRLHELAQAIVLSRSNVTRLIDRIEKEGFIAREHCADDRRGAFAAITYKGRELRRKMWTIYRGEIARLFSAHLTAAEARTIKSSLDKVLAAARAVDATAD